MSRTDLPAAVLFDMDGTLVDSEKVWTVAMHDTAAHLGGELSAAARTATIGSDLARTLGIVLADLGLPDTPQLRARAEAFMLARTVEMFGEGLEWRPGAREALELAGARGPVALVTNTGRATAEKALDSIGRHWFTATVCGDEVPAGKPAPDPYLRAAQLLGVEPGDCLAVEDSPTGATAAVAAGMPVLVVPCEVPVPGGPGRVHRDSLVGLTAEDLRVSHEKGAADRAGRADPAVTAP